VSRSKALIDLDSSKTGTVGLNPARSMMYVRVSLCCAVLSCVGRDFEMLPCLNKGVLPVCLKGLVASELFLNSNKSEGLKYETKITRISGAENKL